MLINRFLDYSLHTWWTLGVKKMGPELNRFLKNNYDKSSFCCPTDQSVRGYLPFRRHTTEHLMIPHEQNGRMWRGKHEHSRAEPAWEQWLLISPYSVSFAEYICDHKLIQSHNLFFKNYPKHIMYFTDPKVAHFFHIFNLL